MSIDTIVDLAYGDTGKARIVDLLLKDYDIVVRFNGSSNCGHTIVYNGKTYLTRIMPSGFLYNNKKLVIAQGLLLDLEVFLNEVKQFQEFDIMSRLLVSNKCHLLLPYHKEADKQNEVATNSKVGSTKNGVAFCVQDKVGRRGLRVDDLLSKSLEDIYNQITDNMIFWDLKVEYLNNIEIRDKAMSLIKEFIELNQKYNFCGDASKYLNDNLKTSNILGENAQGFYLDLENGYFPFVTSVPCSAAGACLGMNIAPKSLSKVIGITKAYVTRVGNGPLQTEIFDQFADILRAKGHEYGSVTKRPRRVGWLNLDELKYACQINGVDEIAITKVDILNDFLYVPVYVNGEYTEMTGWKNHKDDNFKKYLELIEKHCSTPVKYVSYGADRNDMEIR